MGARRALGALVLWGVLLLVVRSAPPGVPAGAAPVATIEKAAERVAHSVPDPIRVDAALAALPITPAILAVVAVLVAGAPAPRPAPAPVRRLSRAPPRA